MRRQPPSRGFRLLLSAASVIALGACGETDPCEPAGLSELLDDASAGDTVRLGACSVDGSFRVPAGVTLEGRGEMSILGGGGAGPVLALDEGARLSALGVSSDGGVAVHVTGDDVVVEDVTIALAGGIGLGARGVSGLRLTRVSVTGPVTEETANDVPAGAGPDAGGAYGIALVDVGSAAAPAVFEDVELVQVGPWGSLVDNSYLSWVGGGVSRSLGTGLLVSGGEVTLDGLLLDRFYQGIQPIPAYGAAFIGGANVTATGLRLLRSDGLGLLVDQSQTTLTDLTASEHAFGAVWVQRSTRFSLTGDGTLIQNNGLAGIVVVRSAGVVITDARIVSTHSELSLFGELSSVRAADGIQLLPGAEAVTLRDLTFENNERVGVLIDVEDAAIDGVQLEGISVSGSGSAFGALAQGAGALIPSGGWDDDVLRTGAAATNDATATDALPVFGTLATGNLPDPDPGAFSPLP